MIKKSEVFIYPDVNRCASCKVPLAADEFDATCVECMDTNIVDLEYPQFR